MRGKSKSERNIQNVSYLSFEQKKTDQEYNVIGDIELEKNLHVVV